MTVQAPQRAIVLAGGGTGGHVLPALALADAFQTRMPEARVLFIGTARGMESNLVPKRGYAIELVPGSRLVGGGLSAKLAGVRALVQGVRAARAILKREKVSLVVGVGGYASGAALLAARSLGIPTAIHESNAVPGLTNRVLGHLVDRVYLGFEAARPDFPHEITVVSGNPVRTAIAATATLRQFPEGRPAHVLIVGGSQGSEFLNARVPELLRTVDTRVHLEIRHQVGKLDPAPVRDRYAELGLVATVEPFIDDMAAAYAWADVAVTRSGSGTVAELAAAGLPALLVPFPHAAGDHQAWNAKAFADSGAGWWVRQAAWEPEALAQGLAGALRDRGAWQRMSLAARAFGGGDAADVVVRDCEDWMEGRW
jgi:UDP-N-acetylglucosamine--N-acetylmuramyl-(pentapeptide) pyrophosphoryl-undecaprenol N-acetylglucosamine transferase